MDAGSSHATSFFGQGLQAADTSQTSPLATTTPPSQRRIVNIKFFWSKGMSQRSSETSRLQKKQPSFTGLSPSAPSLAPQQHQSQSWQCSTTMVPVCTGAEATLESSRSRRQQRERLLFQIHQNLSGYHSVIEQLLTLGISNIKKHANAC